MNSKHIILGIMLCLVSSLLAMEIPAKALKSVDASLEALCKSLYYSSIKDDVQSLIKECADLNKTDTCNMMPLCIAAQKGYFKAARLLIEHGADVNARDGNETTPLYYAVARGHIKICELLIGKGAKVNVSTQGYFIPLHRAVDKGYTEVVRLLIENGADVARKDGSGNFPLELAANRNHTEICRLLIEHGAQVNDGNGRSLGIAADGDCLEACALLIQKGAHVNACDGRGDTPLHKAAARLFGEDICKLLLKNGACITAQNRFGKTPLHYAVSSGRPQICKLLVENGADMVCRDGEGKTMLERAVGERNILEVLVGSLYKSVFLPDASSLKDARDRIVTQFLMFKHWPDTLPPIPKDIQQLIVRCGEDFFVLWLHHYTSERKLPLPLVSVAFLENLVSRIEEASGCIHMLREDRKTPRKARELLNGKLLRAHLTAVRALLTRRKGLV